MCLQWYISNFLLIKLHLWKGPLSLNDEQLNGATIVCFMPCLINSNLPFSAGQPRIMSWKNKWKRPPKGSTCHFHLTSHHDLTKQAGPLDKNDDTGREKAIMQNKPYTNNPRGILKAHDLTNCMGLHCFVHGYHLTHLKVVNLLCSQHFNMDLELFLSIKTMLTFFYY